MVSLKSVSLLIHIIFNHKYIYRIMDSEKKNGVNGDLQIELKEEIASGIYANLAIISHSSSEFILDFIRVLPGLPKPSVQSRIIMAPEHAKRLLRALEENIGNYERVFGPITMPEEKVISAFPKVTGEA